MRGLKRGEAGKYRSKTKLSESSAESSEIMSEEEIAKESKETKFASAKAEKEADMCPPEQPQLNSLKNGESGKLPESSAEPSGFMTEEEWESEEEEWDSEEEREEE